MDVYENYKAMAEELFRLKTRLTKCEASETRLAAILAIVGNHLRDGKIVDPTMIRDALTDRPKTA